MRCACAGKRTCAPVSSSTLTGAARADVHASRQIAVHSRSTLMPDRLKGLWCCMALDSLLVCKSMILLSWQAADVGCEREPRRLTRPPTAPNIGRMEQELTSLELKLDTLVHHVLALRTEGVSLRERVAALEAENQRLKSKLEVATTRIESVLAMIPESMES